MVTRAGRPQRRTEALSGERIVEAAVELLDTVGEAGLTFRALAERLATGPGAIYWHVANKDVLLAAATGTVIEAALSADEPGSPREKVHAVALGLFDAIDEHPWLADRLAAQLPRDPWGSVTLLIFERIGRQVRALGGPESSWLTATMTLVSYILGAAGQNATNARAVAPDVKRAEHLAATATAWKAMDPKEHPFVRAVADQLAEHDDREQFLAGVDLVLAGITASHPGKGRT
jgi:AcrR family transcriptional regulator